MKKPFRRAVWVLAEIINTISLNLEILADKMFDWCELRDGRWKGK